MFPVLNVFRVCFVNIFTRSSLKLTDNGQVSNDSIKSRYPLHKPQIHGVTQKLEAALNAYQKLGNILRDVKYSYGQRNVFKCNL